MSYSIIYEKQFIKVSDSKVIPIIVGGDSNVYNNDNTRCRDTYNPLINGARMINLHDINEELNYTHNQYFDKKREKTENNIEKDFGFLAGIALYGKGTHKTTWNMYKNVFLNGFKQALTVEQLSSEGFNISIKVSRKLGTTLNPSIDDLSRGGFKTTEDLLNHMETVMDATKVLSGYGFYFRLEVYDIENKIKRVRRKYFPTNKKVKVPTEVDNYYVIKLNVHDQFLLRSSKSGIHYSNRTYGAKAFIDEKAAKATIKRLLKRSWRDEMNFEVIKVEEKRTILV